MCRRARAERGEVATAAHVTLPLPPSVNALWFNRPGVGRVRSTQYQNWIKSAGWELKSQRPPHVAGDISVSIRAGRPSRRRDLDSIFKGLLDLLVSCQVVDDDRYVNALMAVWDSTIEPGRCRVSIRSLGGDA
jgi:Holliday junction resolvase RusA-like endonuclease